MHFYSNNLNAIRVQGIPRKTPTAQSRGTSKMTGKLTVYNNYGLMYGVINATSNAKIRHGFMQSKNTSDGIAVVTGTLTAQ